jgi:hypothetical protein
MVIDTSAILAWLKHDGHVVEKEVGRVCYLIKT